MFDAAAAATAAESLAGTIAAEHSEGAWDRYASSSQDAAGPDLHARNAEASASDAASEGSEQTSDTDLIPAAVQASVSGQGNGDRSFIFIDKSMDGYAQLAELWADRGIVVLIDSSRDGIDQIREALSGQVNIDSIHLVSHGQAGGFMIGSTWVDANRAQGDLRSSLQAIGAKLSENGDILLYGCDIGADDSGRALLNALAAVTGADIAASDNATGSAEKGGDWILEARAGSIETLALDAANWDWLMAQQVINPTGGILANGSDGIRIYITTTGQMQVLYQNQHQFYFPDTTVEGSSLFNGIYVAFDNLLVGPQTGAFTSVAGIWSSDGQTLTGTGTTADPFIVTTRLYADFFPAGYQPATDYLVTVQSSYVAGTRYFTNTVTITPPPTNTRAIKYYHAADTFLGGSDQGAAYALAPGGATTNTSANISVIATRRDFGLPTENFVGFAEVDGGRQFDRFYSGYYAGSDLYNGVLGAGMVAGGNIVNTIDTNPLTDNGLGIQFNLGTPTTTPVTFSYRLVFDGDTRIDLDANNSTAPGDNYVTSFAIGSNQPLAVVDSDVLITNVIADISRATVTINNAQAGDVLSVTGTLPTGITATVVGNTLTLSGSATEAAYQDALKQIRFNTSSTAAINRSLTVNVYNEITSSPATATTTINVGRPPVVDLNSGVVSSQMISNGNFSSGATGWTATGSGGLTTTGDVGYLWSTDSSAGTLTRTGLSGWSSGFAPSGAAQLSFDLAWNNPIGTALPAAANLRVSIGGVIYATLVTGTTATQADIGTITYSNGAAGDVGTIAATTVSNPVRTRVTIDLPSTVANLGDLVFSFTSASSGDDIFIDNVSAFTSVDAVAGLNYSTSYTENGAGVSIASINNSVRDVDSANMVSGRIVLTNAQAGDVLTIGTLPAGITGSLDTSTPGQIVVNLSGTATQSSYAAAIRAVTFSNSSDAPSTVARVVQVTVNDGAQVSAVATTTIAVVAVNDAPVVSVPSNALTTPEDTPIIFSAAAGLGLTVTDVDDATLTVLIAVENGTFQLSTTAGLTFQRSTHNNSGTLLFSGSVAAISAALADAVFTPTTDNSGNAQIRITTSDSALSATEVIAIDMTPVADAVDDSVTTNLGTPVVATPIVNDNFAGPSYLVSVTAPANGSAVANPNGSVTYTPNANFVGTDSFSYTAATVDLGFLYRYSNYNPSPGATNTFASVFPGGFPTTFQGSGWTEAIFAQDGQWVAAENADPDSSTTIEWSGQFLVLTAGTYTFNVQADNVARLFIDGQTVQTNGYSSPNATVNVTLTAGVHNFVLQYGDGDANDEISINYSGADTGGVLTNVSSSGLWGHNVRYESATVNVTVVDQPPTVTGPAAVTAAEDTPRAIAGVSVADVDSASVTVTLTTTGGTAAVGTTGVTVSGNGTPVVTVTGSVSDVNTALAALSFTGNADYNGAAQILVGVADARSSASSVIAITIDPVADITNDVISASEDVPVSFNVLTGTNGATADNFENPTRLISSVTQPPAGQGTVTFAANGLITYTPPANFNGTTSFTYTVSSGGVFETATVTVNVAAVNDAPQNTLPATLSVTEDVAQLIPGLSVVDVDDDAVRVTLAVQNGTLTAGTLQGTVTGNGTSSVTIIGTQAQVNAVMATIQYQGAPDFNGADTLTMTTSDGLVSDVDTMAITVAAVADIVADTVTTAEDNPISFNVLTGTNGASADNFESATRFVSSVTQPPAGQGGVTFSADGLITYTPPANYNGTTSFTYSVTSGGVVETATVTVNVTAVNDVPLNSLPASWTVVEDVETALTGLSIADPDGDVMSVTLTVLHGLLVPSVNSGTITGANTASVTISGSVAAVNAALAGIRYQPVADYYGTDTLTMVTGDGTATDTDSRTITVTPVQDITNDAVTTAEDTPFSFNVLTGTNGATADNFENADRAVVSVTQPPASAGSVTFNAAGLITFTPAANYHGTASFTYTVRSGGVDETATVTVTVTEVNDAPQGGTLNDQESADGQSIILPLAPSFSDVDGDTLSYSAVGLPSGLTINAATGVISGSINRSASQANSGNYSVTVTVADGRGGSIDRTFNWHVVNPAPVALNDTATTVEDTSVIISVLANDTDADADPLRVTTAVAANGQVVLNANGTITYTPAADFNGVDTIIYTMTDDEGGTSTASVTVTVNAVNDAPVASILPPAFDKDGETVSLSVAGYFSDVDGDVLTYSATGLPLGINIDPATGIISGTLASDASAQIYNVTVTATDGSTPVSSSFVWTIQNVPPMAVDDLNVSVPEDAQNFMLTVLDNDFDPDLDEIFIDSASASSGSVQISPDFKTLLYTPVADYNGPVTITYTITDNGGGFSTATVYITVVAENDAPVIVEDLPDAVNADWQSITLDVSDYFSDVDGDSLTYTATGLPGSLVVDPTTGVISGTIARNASQGGAGGVYTVTITASDGTASVSQTFSWRITNPGPTAADDSINVDEDTGIEIDALGNDTDPDGDTLTIFDYTVTNGTATILPNGNFRFVPAQDFVGQATIVYTVTDGQNGFSTATIRINVIGVNDPPVAVNDLAVTDEDVAVSIPVLVNDSDVEGDALSVESATALNGTVSIGAGGILVYTPNANFHGTDTITYVITDGDATDTATVTVTVRPVNDPPVANDDAVTINEDTPQLLSPLGNDVDVENDTLTIISASAVNGSVAVNANGTINYVPNANYFGTDTVTYTISDGNGGFSTAVIVVTINAVNDAPAPVGSIVAQSSMDNDPVSLATAGAFIDVDSVALTYSATGLPAGLTINSTTGIISGTIDRSASQTQSGEYNVVVTASDGALSATQTFLWNVANPPPVAANDTASTDEDTSVLIDVLDNDVDPDGDLLEVISASAVYGQVSIQANGQLLYTPNQDFNGQDVITYTIRDADNATSTATVTVTVDELNDDPIATSLSAINSADSATISGVSVATAFSDPDGDTLSYTATGLPAGLTLDSVTGEISGTINSSASQGGPAGDGVYTVTITADDGDGGTVSTSFDWTVTNPPPTAVDDIATVEEDSVAAPINVLANDTDPDGDVLSVVSASAANGSVTINADYTISYTPNANYTGTDIITYVMEDADGTQRSAQVVVTVTPVNDAPTPVGSVADQANVEGSSVSISVAPNFADIDDASLTYSATGLPPGLTIDPASGVISGTIDRLAAGGAGTQSYAVVITAKDAGGLSATQSFSWAVTNPSPVADNDTATTNEDTSVTIDVLGNDTDQDGDALTVTSAIAGNGTVVINPDGTITYTPNANFHGSDTIVYTVDDGQSGSDTASVLVTVNSVNDAPVAATLPDRSNGQLTPLNIAFAPAFTDADGDVLTYSATGLPDGLSIDPVTGEVSGTTTATSAIGGPLNNGVYTVTVTVSDGNGGTTSANFTWTISNSEPVAVDDVATVDEDTSITIDVLANDVDPDGPLPANPIVSVSATHGTVVVNADNSVTFTPDPNFNGIATITYTIVDTAGAFSTADVVVTVRAINDEPVVVQPPAQNSSDGETIPPLVLGPLFSDVDGDTLSFSATGLPPGLAIDAATGTITGTVSADASIGGPNGDGIYLVTVTASDGNGGTVSTQISWTATNLLPVANPDVISTNEDTLIVIPVLANDIDPDGDPLTVIDASATNGTVTINPDNSISFLPNANFNGTAQITYVISDGNGGTSTSTVTVTVNPVNDAPDAVGTLPTRDANDGDTLTYPTAPNFTDIDSPTLAYSATGLPDGLAIDPVTGEISGTLPPNASQTNGGVYIILVTATDPDGLSATQSFTLRVANLTPVAQPDIVTTPEDTPITIDVLANDSDPDGDPLTISSASATSGTVAINPDGTLSFVPAADFYGVVTITYVVSDGNGGTATSTVTVTVTAVNDAPVAVDDVITSVLDESVTIPVLVNDVDAEGDPLTVIEATADRGTVSINPDGTLKYTPPLGFVGEATITYVVSDGNGGTSTATVTISVVPGDAQPDIETLLEMGAVRGPDPILLPEPYALNMQFIMAPPVVLRAVNDIASLHGTLDLNSVEGAVLGVVNQINPLNGTGGFGSDGMPVLEEVDRIERSNRLQSGGGMFARHADGIDARFFAGSSLSSSADASGVVFETLIRGGSVYLEIRAIDGAQTPEIVRYELVGTEEVPSWMRFDPRGLLIIDAPAGVDIIPLTIRAVREDGSYSQTSILVRSQSGQVEIQEQYAVQGGKAVTLDRATAEAADRAAEEAARLVRVFGQ